MSEKRGSGKRGKRRTKQNEKNVSGNKSLTGKAETAKDIMSLGINLNFESE